MNWSLFWEAFGAIGTTVGSLITAIAVIVAVIQYKQPLIKKVKITTGTSFSVCNQVLGENCLCISLMNTGIRSVIITNIYLNAGKENLVINNLMVDYSSADFKVEFPKEIHPESTINIHIPYSQLSDSMTNVLNRKKINPNQKIKILATDTTLGKYYCKTKLKAKYIANMK